MQGLAMAVKAKLRFIVNRIHMDCSEMIQVYRRVHFFDKNKIR